MAVIQPVLSLLFQDKIDANISSISLTNPISGSPYSGAPLGQDDPSYFIEMCNAISTGIAFVTAITCSTDDDGLRGVPLVAGVGAGVGMFIDPLYFEERIYTIMRDFIIADFGSSTHQVYPPTSGSGLFLQAFAKGIAESVEEHFKVSWAMVTAHPGIYVGTSEVPYGGFSGLSASAIKLIMEPAAPRLSANGVFWERQCEAISLAYVDTVHNKAKNENIIIAGVCIPAIPPLPPQICGIPDSGSGSGLAV